MEEKGRKVGEKWRGVRKGRKECRGRGKGGRKEGEPKDPETVV